jgi:hypothetical protein
MGIATILPGIPPTSLTHVYKQASGQPHFPLLSQWICTCSLIFLTNRVWSFLKILVWAEFFVLHFILQNVILIPNFYTGDFVACILNFMATFYSFHDPNICNVGTHCNSVLFTELPKLGGRLVLSRRQNANIGLLQQTSDASNFCCDGWHCVWRDANPGHPFGSHSHGSCGPSENWGHKTASTAPHCGRRWVDVYVLKIWTWSSSLRMSPVEHFCSVMVQSLQVS